MVFVSTGEFCGSYSPLVSSQVRFLRYQSEVIWPSFTYSTVRKGSRGGIGKAGGYLACDFGFFREPWMSHEGTTWDTGYNRLAYIVCL